MSQKAWILLIVGMLLIPVGYWFLFRASEEQDIPIPPIQHVGIPVTSLASLWEEKEVDAVYIFQLSNVPPRENRMKAWKHAWQRVKDGLDSEGFTIYNSYFSEHEGHIHFAVGVRVPEDRREPLPQFLQLHDFIMGVRISGCGWWKKKNRNP